MIDGGQSQQDSSNQKKNNLGMRSWGIWYLSNDNALYLRYALRVSHRNITVGPKDYLHSYAACRECVYVCVYFVELLVDHLA